MIDQIFTRLNTLVPEKWKWILEHGGFKRYFKNTGWMFVGQMFNIISLVVNIWVARYLGPHNFGIMNYALAFVGMFSFIANLGVSGVLVRELVNFPEKRNVLLGTAFVLTLGGGITAFIVTTLAAIVIIDSTMIRNLTIVFALTFILSSITIIASYFQATVQARKNVYAQIGVTMISSILKIIIIFSGKGIIWFVLLYVVDYVLYGMWYLKNYLKTGFSVLDWSFDKKMAMEILSVSWLLMFSSAMAYLYLKIDQVMIEYYLDTVAVGLYAAGVRLVEIWYFIPGIICASLLPAIINAKKADIGKYRRRLRNLYLLLALVAIGVAVPTTLLASWIIKLFFGIEYIESVSILKIYIWSGIGLFLTLGINQYFLAENRLYTLCGFGVVGVILNIVLNAICIPRFGLNGAAWATLVSYSVTPVCVYMYEVVRKRMYVESK